MSKELSENEAMLVFNVDELELVQAALKHYMKENEINDHMDLYFYVTRQLADLQVSLNEPPAY